MIRVSTAFFVLIFLNLLLTALFNYTGSQIFSSANNGLAASSLAAAAIAIVIRGKIESKHLVFTIVLFCFVLATVVANFGKFELVDVVKYLGVYILFGFGYYVLAPAKMTMVQLASLAVFAITCAALFKTRIYDANIAFAFFPNANTATLFFTSLLFASVPKLGSRAIVIQVLQAVAFRKVGVVVATLLSIAFWSAQRLSFRALGLLAAGGVVLAALAVLGLLDRPIAVVTSLLGDVTSLGVSRINALTYDDLIERQRSTDLSGYFRIRHWTEIWMHYSQGDWAVILFGYGPGTTPAVTSARLIPHNDYLRVLAEFGAANLFMFVTLTAHIVFSLGRGASRTLFTVLAIYFFSENLIDNFPSMAIFYAVAGVYCRERALARKSVSPTDLAASAAIERRR